MNYKELIIKELKEVKREGMDKLIDWLEKSDFFTAPASTKYHGNYEKGLSIHSWNVFEQLKNKCDYWKKEKPDIKLPDLDSKRISALLHDICKCNIYKIGYRNVKENNQWAKKEVWEVEDQFPLGHGGKSVIILQNFIKLKQEEMYAINWHMGRTGNYIEDMQFSSAIEKCPFVLLLHLADYESSYLLEETKK